MPNITASHMLCFESSSEYLITKVMKAEAGFNLPMHTHEFYHVNFVISGQVEVGCEGEVIFAKSGTLFILPPNVPHSIKSEGGYLQVGMDLQKTENGSVYPLLEAVAKSRALHYNLSYMVKEFEQLFKNFQETPLKRLQLRNFGERLLLTALGAETASKNADFLEKLNSVLENADYGITVQELAMRMFISKASLERYMRSSFSMSAKEYLNSRRLSQIYYYLLETDLKIERIAELLCFYDTAHLITFFKRQTGLTPKTFRKSLQ